MARGLWNLDNVGVLTATYAFQRDQRKEFDRGRRTLRGPQLSFDLRSQDFDVNLAHLPVHFSDSLHLSGEIGASGLVQDHIYVGAPLVPSHQALGFGAFVNERLIGHDWEVEAGARYEFLARTADFFGRDFQRLVRGGQVEEGNAPVGLVLMTFEPAIRHSIRLRHP